MKRQHYKLKIERPCNQEWTSMTEDGGGRYCSHCSKSVLDLTQLTDDQIFERISKSNGKVCGRLTQKQLQQEIVLGKQREQKSLVTQILGGVLLLSIADNIHAQEIKSAIEIVHNQRVDKHKKQNKEEQLTTKDSLRNIIEGKVVDAYHKEPLAYARVTVKGTEIITFTDESGNFCLMLPDSLMPEKITLVFNFVSYYETEFSINRKDLPLSKEVLIIKMQGHVLGEVDIIRKKRWWQFWRKK